MKKFLSIKYHIFWILQLVVSVILVANVYRYLPLKYLILGCIILLLLVAIMAFMQISRRTNKIVKIGGNVVSILLCVTMVFSNVMIIDKVNNALESVTNGNIKTTQISVIVKKDSSFNKIKELDGKHFGIMSKVDRVNSNYMLDHLNRQFDSSLTKNQYTDTQEMLNALFNNEIDAIILNEGFRDSINLIDTSFESNTKVIYQIDRKEELKNKKKTDVTKEPFIVYVSGIDTNGPISTTSLSDVNMLLAINPIRKEVTLVFIPRDYFVPLQCPKGSCDTGELDKLTHSGMYGIEVSEATVSALLDVDINYNVRINFDTLTTMVDALGGIDIYSGQDVNLLHATCEIKKGIQHVDGACALGFARERYAYESGDRHRGLNQQEVIRAMIEKLSTKTVLNNFPNILNAVEGLVQTNMTENDIKSFVAMQLNDMAKWKINSISLDGDGMMSLTYSFGGQYFYVMVPNEETISLAKKAIDDIIK